MVVTGAAASAQAPASWTVEQIESATRGAGVEQVAGLRVDTLPCPPAYETGKRHGCGLCLELMNSIGQTSIRAPLTKKSLNDRNVGQRVLPDELFARWWSSKEKFQTSSSVASGSSIG